MSLSFWKSEVVGLENVLVANDSVVYQHGGDMTLAGCVGAVGAGGAAAAGLAVCCCLPAVRAAVLLRRPCSWGSVRASAAGVLSPPGLGCAAAAVRGTVAGFCVR